MKYIKRMLGVLILILLILGVCVCCAQTAPTVNVVLDGTDIASGELIENRTLVPLRVLSETMGYNVSWDGNTQMVTVTNGSITNILTIGSSTALRTENGTAAQITLDVAPMLIDSRTYVPLRYIAESLNSSVFWQADTQSALICSPQVITFRGQAVSVNMLTEAFATENFGGSYDIIDGADGIRRMIYIAPEDGAMTVLGFYENHLFEFFSNDTLVKLGDLSISQMKQGTDLPQNVHVFYDVLAENAPVGMYMNAAGKRYSPHRSAATKEATMQQESKLVYYLTNSLRKKAGMKDLVFSEELAQVDKAHVASMAENKFLAHKGLAGDNITERISAAPRYTKYTLLGEILACMPNGYYACYGWLNSQAHREAMLNGTYVYTGICVDGNISENLYYAQVLVKL